MTGRHGFSDQEIREANAGVVVPLRPTVELQQLPPLIDSWLAEYPNARTRERYGTSVRVIAAAIDATAPADFTAAAVAGWATTYEGANNTVRAHLTGVRTFLRWCQDTGHLTTYRDRPLQRLLRSYPPTYGKVESRRPANRLDEAQYQQLLAACNDATDAGMRDELLVRLGVSGGMRCAELINLTVGALRNAPNLTWRGKANKPRTARAGQALVALIRRYLDTYEQGLGRPLADTDPVFCRSVHSRNPGDLAWGHAMTTGAGIRLLIQRRATAAGLDYLAPHDLKRTAARMMHEARSADGGHVFDLLDIAEVLDHSNPKVTKDCYIGPLGNANKDRAADLFD